MKKRLFIILTVLFMLFTTSCSGNPDAGKETTGGETVSDVVDTKKETEAETKVEETEEASLYTETVSIPMKDISINYKNTRRLKTGYNTFTFYNNEDYVYTAFVNDRFGEYSGDLDGVVDVLEESFLDETDFWCKGDVSNSKIVITEKENVTVNTFEGFKFEANIDNGRGGCYTYGYAFLDNNIPFMLIGVVSTDEQEQESIDSMIEEVDSMAATLRRER